MLFALALIPRVGPGTSDQHRFGDGDARLVVRMVALAMLEVPTLAVCGLSMLSSRGSHHLPSHSDWEGQPHPLNLDPAQTSGPGQVAYAGVGTCLIKKQAHDSQPCNYGHGLLSGCEVGEGRMKGR